MTLDYRQGRNTWGHALHAHTMRQVRPAKLLDRIKDRGQKAYRAQVMIHSPTFPKVGEPFLWTAAAGHEVHATVYDVEPRLDPQDMYTVFLRVKSQEDAPDAA